MKALKKEVCIACTCFKFWKILLQNCVLAF